MNAFAAIARRAEDAMADDQAQVLDDLWDELGPTRRWQTDQARAFGMMMDAGAYESAAILMVPSPGKWSITSSHADGWQACIWTIEGGYLDWRPGATPALALAAAVARIEAQRMAA